jgi:serpin B
MSVLRRCGKNVGFAHTGLWLRRGRSACVQCLNWLQPAFGAFTFFGRSLTSCIARKRVFEEIGRDRHKEKEGFYRIDKLGVSGSGSVPTITKALQRSTSEQLLFGVAAWSSLVDAWGGVRWAALPLVMTATLRFACVCFRLWALALSSVQTEGGSARGRRVTVLRPGRTGLVALCVGASIAFCVCRLPVAQAAGVRKTTTARSSAAARVAPFSLSGAEVEFATDLYGQLARTSGNVVFSPSSVSAVLGMLLVGAGGNTASELRSALHLGGVDDSGVIAAAAALHQLLAPLADDRQSDVIASDELWPQRGYAISPSFIAAVRRGWDGMVQAIDYSDPARAASTIDAAVSAATHGLVPRLLSPQALTPPVDLVVTDTVYLHARWAYPFNPSQTAPAPFYGTTTQQVATMHESAPLGYARHAGYQVVELPYAGGRLEMTILLPNGKLAPLETRFERRGLADLATGVQPTRVTLSLPRFIVSSQQVLNDDLKALGITDAFSPSTADFAGIGPHRLFLSDVVHQAVVKVAEKGTVAAAATGAVVAPTAVEANPGVTVTVDRPFLFTIADTATGTPLFLGRVVTP